MERLTQEGLDQLVALLAERIGDPRIPPAAPGGYSLRHTVAHAIRGVEAYLELAAGRPVRPQLETSRAQAEELWRTLERSAGLLDHEAEADVSRPTRSARAEPPSTDDPSGTDPSSRATLTTIRIGQVLVLRLAGELDLGSTDIFRATVLEEAAALVLDLSRVDFCDSTGLSTLLRLRAEAEGRAIRVHLAAPSGQVTRLLEITGADKVFQVHTGMDDAVAALA